MGGLHREETRTTDEQSIIQRKQHTNQEQEHSSHLQVVGSIWSCGFPAGFTASLGARRGAGVDAPTVSPDLHLCHGRPEGGVGVAHWQPEPDRGQIDPHHDSSLTALSPRPKSNPTMIPSRSPNQSTVTAHARYVCSRWPPRWDLRGGGGKGTGRGEGEGEGEKRGGCLLPVPAT